MVKKSKKGGKRGSGQLSSQKDGRSRKIVSFPGREIFPVELCVTLKYVQQCTNSNAGAIGSQTFKINSVFDPGALTTTGSAHQPKGFDQYALFFNEYLVISARVKATTFPLGATTSTTGVLMITFSDTTTVFGSSNHNLEDPKVRRVAYGGLGSAPASVTHKWSLSNDVLAGADVRSQMSGNYSAIVTAAPADLWYCFVTNGTAVDSGVLTTQANIVEIEQTVLFTSRKNLPQS